MYKLNPNIFYKTVTDQKIMLVDVLNNDSTMLEIHGVSVEVFLALLDGKEVDAIAKDIAGKYSVSEDVVQADIKQLLQDLDKHKIFAAGK